MGEQRPLRPFLPVQEEVRRLFQELIHQPWGSTGLTSADLWQPCLDMCETDEAIIIEVELPGVQREDVHLDLQGNLLRITGERRTTTEQQGRNYYRLERSQGRFERQLQIPASVEREAIGAAFEAGLLTITLPKRGTRKEKP